MHATQKAVYQFHKAFDLPRPLTPTFDEFSEVRVGLVEEEAAELRDAFEKRDVIAAIDALCDLLYVVNGAAVALGVDLAPFFKAVHDNNMTKLGPDGEPIYREDGKVLKPNTFTPVDLKAVYRKVYNSEP